MYFTQSYLLCFKPTWVQRRPLRPATLIRWQLDVLLELDQVSCRTITSSALEPCRAACSAACSCGSNDMFVLFSHSDVAVKCKLLKWKTERCSFFCLTLSSTLGLSQHACGAVWRYIMALLLIRVVSSSMETWPASNMHLMWITCGLFLFPLMVSDPCERATTGCLFSYTLDVILIPFADLVFWTCFLSERSKNCLPCLMFDLANSCMLLLGWGSVVLQDCCIFTVYLISRWL